MAAARMRAKDQEAARMSEAEIVEASEYVATAALAATAALLLVRSLQRTSDLWHAPSSLHVAHVELACGRMLGLQAARLRLGAGGAATSRGAAGADQRV